jgi:hypothetical protein
MLYLLSSHWMVYKSLNVLNYIYIKCCLLISRVQKIKMMLNIQFNHLVYYVFLPNFFMRYKQKFYKLSVFESGPGKILVICPYLCTILFL